MKRHICILALALIASFSANASSFYLHFARQANYTVSIDGIYYKVNDANFRIPTLRPGRHTLTVESFTQSRNEYRRPMPVVLFNGPLMVNEYSDIFASVDNCGFHIDRVVAHTQSPNNRRQYHYKYNDFDNQYNEFYDEDKPMGNNYNGNHDQNMVNYDAYMNSNDFQALKQSINNASFETTKSSVAMSGISKNNMSVGQIKEIIQLFSFESTKVEIAKYAYNYTTDKNKYYELNDAFSFDSSKNEIAQLGGTR